MRERGRFILREKLYKFLLPFLTTTTFFIIIFLAAWYFNGIGKTHFDLGQLQTFYLAVAGVSVTGHTVNSVFNSPRGQAPERG